MSSWPPPSAYPAPEAAPWDAPPPPLHRGYELRPLSLGETLDRTFTVYRRNFWLIAGISAISGAVQLLANVLQIGFIHFGVHHMGRTGLTTTSVIATVLGTLVFWLAASITQAATVFALGEVYLGKEATVVQSLRAVAARWWRFPLIGLWQVGSMVWLPAVFMVPLVILTRMALGRSGAAIALLVLLTLAAFVVGYIFFLRNSLGVPVEVMERPGVRQSMRRSKVLTKGAKGTIFVLYLIFMVLYMAGASVIGIAALVFGYLFNHGHHSPTAMLSVVQGVSAVMSFFIQTIIVPVILVGMAVIYFNERVKKEAFDLLVLMGEESPLAAESLPTGEPLPVETSFAAAVEPEPPAPTSPDAPLG